MFRKQLSDVTDPFNGLPTIVTRSTLENRQTGSRSMPLAPSAAIFRVSDVTASWSSQPEPEMVIGVATTPLGVVSSHTSGRSSPEPSVISQWTRARRDVAVKVDVDTSGVEFFVGVVELLRLGEVRSRPMTDVMVTTTRTSTARILLRCIVLVVIRRWLLLGLIRNKRVLFDSDWLRVSALKLDHVYFRCDVTASSFSGRSQ